MTAFEQQLLEVMGGLIDAIDRQTEAFRVATDAQLLTAKKNFEQTEQQFRFYSGIVVPLPPNTGEEKKQ